MFFVVYFIAAAVHRVVPYTWIIGISEHIQKFVNHSLNRNQEFTAFWTNQAGAYDDHNVPLASFVSTDMLANATHFDDQFPREGLYSCYLVRFESEFRYFC